MEFMSQEHVDEMNRLLALDPEIKAQSATLTRDYRLLYRLRRGPGGDPVYWTMTFTPSGVTYSLEEIDNADLTLRADWGQTIESSKAAKEGRTLEHDVTAEGDPDMLTAVGAVFARARQVADIEVTFPAS